MMTVSLFYSLAESAPPHAEKRGALTNLNVVEQAFLSFWLDHCKINLDNTCRAPRGAHNQCRNTS